MRPKALFVTGAVIVGMVAATPTVALAHHRPGHTGGSGGGGASPTYVPGIDVSHWQGTINWSSVARAGMKFAIAKATEGQTYNDPTYTTNRNGAESNGLKFTAYHFARPDTSTNDATIEADHLVNVATLHSGEMVPALDLEVSGGLGVTALKTWVTTWLNRVSTRMNGVKPMIYTSNYFWKTYMGDTSYFANNGYRILWIAHWTSNSAPSVPAANWGGYSWTFWQWSDCTSVSGISGCVDGDRYRYTDFTQVLIP